MRLVVERNEIKTKVKISFSERIVRFVVPCSKRPTVFIHFILYLFCAVTTWPGLLRWFRNKAKDVDLNVFRYLKYYVLGPGQTGTCELSLAWVVGVFTRLVVRSYWFSYENRDLAEYQLLDLINFIIKKHVL